MFIKLLSAKQNTQQTILKPLHIKITDNFKKFPKQNNTMKIKIIQKEQKKINNFKIKLSKQVVFKNFFKAVHCTVDH